jgi:hypothetical protein
MPVDIIDPPDSPRSRLKPVSETQSVKLRRAVSTWYRLRGDVFAPSRAHVQPAELKDALPWLVIVDVLDDGMDYRFALGGQRTIELVGGRHAGVAISQLSESPFFSRVGRFFTRCCEDAAPIAVGPITVHKKPSDWLEAEAVALPLSDDGARVTGILAVMDLTPLSGDALRKFVSR